MVDREADEHESEDPRHRGGGSELQVHVRLVEDVQVGDLGVAGAAGHGQDEGGVHPGPDEDADELDEVGLGTYALCDECVSRLTPVADDRAEARDSGETRTVQHRVGRTLPNESRQPSWCDDGLDDAVIGSLP